VVNNEARKEEFTIFCEQKTWIAIDTESAPMSSGCDLVQIGNDELVYLIAVAEHRQFLVGIATLLASERQKNIFQFGSDDFQKFARQVGVSDIVCNVIDVQRSNSLKNLISLGDLFSKTFNEKFALCKTWRISGWDNPVLLSRQEEYAALDVVCLSKLAKLQYPNIAK
jgi:ribonuclease D